MGTQRTSNKDVLNALNDGFDRLIDALGNQQVAAPAPAAPVAEATGEQVGESTIKVDGAYLEHMKLKVQDFANAKGEDAILYARKNGRGETKLAYCLGSKWTTLRDRGLIGPVEHISPTS